MKMAGRSLKVKQSVKGGEVMRTLFGEEDEGMEEDGLEGSKEENQIFMNVFYGTSVDGASSSFDVYGPMKLQAGEGRHAKGSIGLNCGTSVLMSYSSTRDSSREALQHPKINRKEATAFDCFPESSSSRTGSDAYNVNAKRKNLSSLEHLNHKNKEPRYSLPDTGDDSVQLDQSKISSSESMQNSLNVSQQVSCRIVESFGQGILSSYHLFNSQGEIDYTGDMDDSAVLHSKCVNQHTGDGKAVMEVKSVTSPASQESFSSGLLVTGGSATPKETPERLVCTDQSLQESSILNSDKVDDALRRVFIRELPTRLHSQAHRLLLDAGWKIDPRKRSDRTKLASSFIAPGGGLSFRALSQAWRSCGDRLHSDALLTQQDENGRIWMDIDVFWGDLADTLSYIEKETDRPENFLSLLDQWKILDPFMAVVWIDKRVGALREGRALRSVRSATFFLRDRKNMILADKGMDQVEGHPDKPDLCSLDSSSQSILPAVEPDCNSELFELAKQGVQELKEKHRCGQVDWKLCSCGEIHKRSLKSLARRIGQGLYNTRCLHSMNSKASASWRKRTNMSSSKSAFMLNSSSSLYPVPSSLEEFSPQGSITMGSEKLIPHCRKPVEIANMNRKESTAKSVNSSIKKTWKKSKKISEIATEVSGKGMKAKLHGKSRGIFDFSMTDRVNDHLDLPFHQEEDYTFRWESTPECIEQSEYLKKQIGSVIKASKTEKARVSAVAEASSTTKKHVKSETKSGRQTGKDKKRNLNMTLVDESVCKLPNVDSAQEDLTNHKSTKRMICNKSPSVSLPQQKKRARPKKVPRHCMESKESLVADDGIIPLESHSEGSNEVLVPAIGVSPGTQNIQKITKAKKSEVYMENGRKRPRGCRIDDDDLLIAAILKNKDFSGTKSFTSKVVPSQSKALRKLKSHKGSCKLLLRTPGKGGKHSMDGRRFILGAKTVLCWLIEMGAVSLKDTIQFRNLKNNEVVKHGRITRDGILCQCCTNILSVSDFKAHSGFKLHKPSLNLFMQSGKPYTLCQLQAWSAEYKSRKCHMRGMKVEELDQNDDTCGLCGDGGELICCDNCPSTYHQACLPSQDLPEGSWYCSNCICEICRDVVNQKEASSSVVMLECSQCEHKYHDTCIKEKVTYNGEVGSGTWFCGESCQEVYFSLRSRVGVLNDIGDGFSWTILRCSHDDQKIHSAQKIAAMAECNTKLAIALTIMEECFLPMVDPRTGIDMIPHVLYNWGSNLARLNYQGFYTVVLEKGDQLLSVASIRLHGATVAEMPLIATCSEHRRQGMCRRLMNAVEKMLKSFKVKMLVLSAIPNLVDTWTSGFGFKPIEDDDEQQLKNVNLMLFPGTSLLKKNLWEATAQESGPTSNYSSSNTEGNSDLCSARNQSKTLVGFDEKYILKTGKQSAENDRIGLDAESLLPINMNMPLELVGSELKNLLLSSCESSLIAGHSKHGDVDNAESCNVQIRTSNIYEMEQFFSTEQAVATSMPGVNIYTSVHSCSGSLTPARNNELPNVPSSIQAFAIIGNDKEENLSQNIDILIEDGAIDVKREGRSTIVEGDEFENKDEQLTIQKEKSGFCFSDEQIKKSPILLTSDLNEQNSRELNIDKVLVDNSVSRDDICASIARQPVAKGFTPENVEA